MDSFFQSHSKLVRILFKNVQNASSLRKLVLQASLPFALIKPKYIMDEFQLGAAVTKAMYNMKEGTMRTKSLYTEIIYCISSTKNISESLQKFGLSDDDTEVLIVGDDEMFFHIQNCIEGEQVPLTELLQLADQQAIKDIYGITEEELEVSTLLDSVVTRISTKEFC